MGVTPPPSQEIQNKIQNIVESRARELIPHADLILKVGPLKLILDHFWFPNFLVVIHMVFIILT